MRPHDPAQLAALARRLDLAPSRLFALAGRVAAANAPLDAARLRREIACVRIAGAAATELAMLPYAAYAIDELDRALMLVAPDVSTREA